VLEQVLELIPFKCRTYLALGGHIIKRCLQFLFLGRAHAACLLISVSSAAVSPVQVPFHGTVTVIVFAVLLELHRFVSCCAFLCLTVICLCARADFVLGHESAVSARK
jgi:hypothetical protein